KRTRGRDAWVNRVLACRHAWRRPRMRPPALSGLREADGGFDPWCTVAAALRRRHAFNAVARVSEAHPGPGCPGALWMADGGWRTWRGSRMRPSALSGLREARTSRWRGRGDGPGLVAPQARGGALRPSAVSGLREARPSRARGRGDGPALAPLQARGGAMRPSALSGLREARASRSRGRGDGPDLATLQARGGAMRPSALSGLREARCGRRAAPWIATHIGTNHGLHHRRLRPAVAVARVSEAHPGTGRPGVLWMAD